MEGSLGFLVETALRSLVVVLAALSPVVAVAVAVAAVEEEEGFVATVSVAAVSEVVFFSGVAAEDGSFVDAKVVEVEGFVGKLVLSDAATARGCCE